MKIIGADIISQTVGTTTSFLGYDGHGSTRTLTDVAGAVTDTFHFDSYGMDLGWDRDTDVEYNQVNKPATDMLYSGEQYDTPLQMQSLRARYYDQNVACFNRLDDYAGNVQDPQSLHKYAYCHGEPVNASDPTGEFSLTEMLVVSAIVGLLASIVGGTIAAIQGKSATEIWKAQAKWFAAGFGLAMIIYGAVWAIHAVYLWAISHLTVALPTITFTGTAAGRMADKARYVPIQLQQMAIKYGQQAPDPQGAKNAIQYTIEIFKNGNYYKLEIVAIEIQAGVYRVLHFLYSK